MKRCYRVTTLLCLLTLPLVSLFAQGSSKQLQAGTECWFKLEKELGLQQRYSVDMELQSMGMVILSKIYRRDGLTRTETTMPMMNLRMVSLELQENGQPKNYVLFPDKKKYCDNSEEEEEKSDTSGKDPAYKLTDAGTEVFEGTTCKKRHLTVTLEEGGTQEMDMLFSPAQKNMPVKMTASTTMKAEPDQPPMTITSVLLFKNYLFATPATSLFTIPKDYVKAASMSEIMMESMGGFTMPQPSGVKSTQGTQAGSPPDLNALIRQAQEAAAKEAAAEATGTTPANTTDQNQSLQQGLQNLRRLMGN